MCVKKIIAFLLAAALSLTALSGCGDLDSLQRQYQQKHPYEEAFETFAPETVMVTVGEAEITWQALFHWIFFNTTEYEKDNGDITDWNQTLETGKTVAEHILTLALSNCLEYAYVEAAMLDMGVEINANVRQSAQDQALSEASNFASYDEFVDAIEAEYSTEDYYIYTKMMSAMYSALYYNRFGSGGEFMEEKEILDYYADDGYMMAKMIRLYRTDMRTGETLSDEEWAERREHCQWILDQLAVCETSEELETRFTELMVENTEDTSLERFPDGYVFQETDMNAAIIEGVQELEEYEYSGIIDAEDSYVIAMRLPVSVDVVPLSQAQYIDYGYYYTLRYLASVEMYNEIVVNWTTQFPAQFSAEYEALDLAELLSDKK